MSDDYSDDFGISHINHEDAQAIVDWAVAASGMVVFMDNMPEHNDTEEGMARLQALINGVHVMVENMPSHLFDIGLDLANKSVDDAIYEEEQVEQFRAELDEL